MCKAVRGRVITLFLIAANIALIVGGVGVVGVGPYLQREYGWYASFAGIRALLDDIEKLIYTAGVFVCCLGVLGCVGALAAAFRGTRWILVIYFILLLGVLCATLYVGFIAYRMPHKIHEFLLNEFRNRYPGKIIIIAALKGPFKGRVIDGIKLGAKAAFFAAGFQAVVILLTVVVLCSMVVVKVTTTGTKSGDKPWSIKRNVLRRLR